MNTPVTRIGVTYFQRKPRSAGNFSIEFIFGDLRSRLANNIDARLVVAPYLSNGLLRRIAICAHSWLYQAHQHGVNHVTGDTTFSAIVLRKRRTVLTVLDCGSFLESQGIKRWLLKKIWFDWPMARSAVVTTISSSVRNELVEFTSCARQKIRVVPVAVSAEFSRHPKVFAATPRILHLGTAPNKNLPRLLHALKGVVCTLVVIGILDERSQQLARDNGIVLENHFNLAWKDVLQQYKECDIVSFTSTYEGFGMPIVEANTVGRAVVTSNLSSMPEVAGKAACLVDPTSVTSIRKGILKVINESSYRESLIENGYENAKRFHPDRIAEMYLDIYRDLSV